jgi:hypothetical protein
VDEYSPKTRENSTASFAETAEVPDGPPQNVKDTGAKFWRRLHVTESGCWLWSGASVRSGYGAIKRGAKTVNAHRLAYELEHGPIPDGACVCHRCNVTLCCNPAHLYLATRADNIRDAQRDGLMPRGERHGRAKLAAADVDAIRAAEPGPKYAQRLAQRFGVHPNTIHRIRRGENWA